ncbi:MAG TPA: HAD-IIB family hydrolase [Gammaproteobacteria bacterium]
MYFLALAADYDGTLARGGRVQPSTVRALERLKESGRRLLLVTGRELEDLLRVFPQANLFDRVVAENGALLYDPATRGERALAPGPPALFVARLRERGVTPLSVGRAIVATWRPHETTVLEAIRDLGLELQIVFNKGAVMVLPAGVNKASGLAAALAELDLSAHNVAAVGDAENDHAFMSACGCAAAVQNALPLVKEAATIVLERDHGAGVEELTERLLADDGDLIDRARHAIAVGRDRAGAEVAIEPQRGAVLIAGSSGIGKSTLATALTERMAERGFAFCVLDPEGDYDELASAVAVGDATTPPQPDEALKLLKSGTSIVVNTQNFNMSERPTFFAELLPRLAALRSRGGRPHWLLVDEAHHLLPAQRKDLAALPDSLAAAILITVHPEAVSAAVLRTVYAVIALGDAGPAVIEASCAAANVPPPPPAAVPREDEVLYWERGGGEPPRAVTPHGPAQTHKRHTRKYADGDLGEEGSFYFRGPEDKLRLRAQNLGLFLQIAEGVDERTWEHHRRRGDYSAWFRGVIKDPELADEAAAIEADDSLGPRESRERIAEAVTRRYTAPSTGGAA